MKTLHNEAVEISGNDGSADKCQMLATLSNGIIVFLSNIQTRLSRKRCIDLKNYLQESIIAADTWQEYELLNCRKLLVEL